MLARLLGLESLRRQPAPVAILKLLSCQSKAICLSYSVLVYITNGLACTVNVMAMSVKIEQSNLKMAAMKRTKMMLSRYDV